MKILIPLLFVSATLFGQTQYNLFTTTISCPTDKTDLANTGEGKIKAALNALVTEGQLLNFESSNNKSKGKIEIVFTVSAESEARFQEIRSAWKKRVEQSDAEFFKTFWQTCKRKDTIMNNHKVMYPTIKSLWSPVAVVEGIDENPDLSLDYNIVFDFAAYNKVGDTKTFDSSAVNWGLTDVGRLYNLHIAAGIPKEKIHFVAAVHYIAETAFFNNEAYQKKYKMDNPNLPLIAELNKAGVRFLLCGQSLTWMGFNKSMLIPQAKVTLTAQTTLSSFQLKGYALKTMENE